MATRYVNNTLYDGHCSGTAQGGSANTITLASSCEEPDDAFNSWGIYIVSGTGAGQSRRIGDYDAATRVATIDLLSGNWAVIPDHTSVYEISVGCDVNMGSNAGLGMSGAFASIDKALEEVGAGDTVYIKAGRPYTRANLNGAVASIYSAGSASYPIRIHGYGETPGDAATHWGDNAYRAVIDGDQQHMFGIGIDPLYEVDYLCYEFAHLRFVNATGVGCSVPLKCASFINCSAQNNGGHGFEAGNCAGFLACEAIGNGGRGISASRGGRVSHCMTGENASDQVYVSGSVSRSVIYGIPAGQKGVYLFGIDQTVDSVEHCVVDGSDGESAGSNTGVYFAGRISLLMNTIVYRCGVGVSQTYVSQASLARNNLYYGNTVNRQYWPADQVGGLSANPQFIDPTEGNYGLAVSSPAVGAGYPANLDLGTIQGVGRQGGSVVHVGMQI